MIEALVGLGFTIAWLGGELAIRRRLGIEPASARAAARLAQKKGAVDARVPAAIFPVGVFFCCAFWESTMRFLLGFERSPWWGVLGAAAAVAFCLARVRRLTASKSSALTRLEVFQLVGIWALLLGAAWSLVLTPWIWFRTRHLPWTALTR